MVRSSAEGAGSFSSCPPCSCWCRRKCEQARCPCTHETLIPRCLCVGRGRGGGQRLPAVVTQVPQPKPRLVRSRGQLNPRNPLTGQYFPKGSKEALAALAARAEAVAAERSEDDDEKDARSGAGSDRDAGEEGGRSKNEPAGCSGEAATSMPWRASPSL